MSGVPSAENTSRRDCAKSCRTTRPSGSTCAPGRNRYSPGPLPERPYRATSAPAESNRATGPGATPMITPPLGAGFAKALPSSWHSTVRSSAQ
jgi:hypothetical protein